MINFPSTPTLNQQYTFGSKSWQWNGFAWDSLAISDTQVARAENAVIAAQAILDENIALLLDSGIIGVAQTIPTAGAYTAGQRVLSSGGSVLGTSGSKYLVTGWYRLTTGSTHVLNTDWVEMRTLTGT